MRQRKYTKEFLLSFVKESTNCTELLTKLGLKISGGTHRLISMRIKEYELDISHFTGSGWNKGKTKKTDRRLEKQSFTARTPHEKVFCINSGFGSSKLYDRLLELNWKKECSICKITNWQNKPLRFHVDHKNGNHTDNQLDNLRIVCPNCHQQTDTWGAKNKSS